MSELKPIHFIILKHLSNGSKNRTEIFKKEIIANNYDISLTIIYRVFPELIRMKYIKTTHSPKFGDGKNRTYYKITKKGLYKYRLRLLEDHIEYFDHIKYIVRMINNEN